VKQSVAYTFTTDPGGFKHDHKLVQPLNGECSAEGTVDGGSFTLTPVGKDSKPDDNAIGVSGTITLPKPKDPAKK
jgi:hypothetical protein